MDYKKLGGFYITKDNRSIEGELHFLGKFELRPILMKDNKIIKKFLNNIKDDKEFTINFIHNLLVYPKMSISELKNLPEPELKNLVKLILKNDYIISKYYFKETTDSELFENFRIAIEKYLEYTKKSLFKAASTFNSFANNYNNYVRPTDLMSLIPKVNFNETLFKYNINNADLVLKSLAGFNSLTSTVIQFQSSVNSISKIIIPQINIWENWVSQNNLIFNNYLTHWQEFEKKFDIAQKDAIQCLSKYKWFMTPSLPIDFVYNIIRICKKGGNQSRPIINRLFIEYFSENEYAELENLVENWKNNEFFKPRMKILRDCVTVLNETSSRANASNLIIPTLITQIDGIQSEFMGYNGLEVTRKGLKDLDGNILKDVDGKPLTKKDWYRDLTLNDELLDSANDIFLNILFQGSKTGKPLKTPFTFSRHKIMHGEYVKYGRKDNTIRAFLILDFLASLIEETKK